MSNDSKISISSDSFERIKSEIKLLSIICNDDVVKKRLVELLNQMSAITGSKDISLEEIIAEKLAETKRTDKELNANLYILYHNLIRGKISEEDAKRIFEEYLRVAEYNKNNFIL